MTDGYLRQAFYFDEFGITDKLLQGLVNGAPYAAAALVGCWLNAPLNSRWGRRGTIAFSCFLAFATAIWQACANHWVSLLVARFVLGLAVGAKSSTTPIYAAECAPKTIRGALTMMWQMWTAFGIMLGFVVSIVFQNVDFLGPNSQWRWMIGVTAVPPMIVGMLVYCMPESPRWYMEKGDFCQSFSISQDAEKARYPGRPGHVSCVQAAQRCGGCQRGVATVQGVLHGAPQPPRRPERLVLHGEC